MAAMCEQMVGGANEYFWNASNKIVEQKGVSAISTPNMGKLCSPEAL